MKIKKNTNQIKTSSTITVKIKLHDIKVKSGSQVCDVIALDVGKINAI